MKNCIIFSCLLLWPVLTIAQVITIAESTLRRAVDEAVEAERVQQNIHGLAIGIIKNGKVVHTNAYGYQDEQYKKKMTTKTDIGWASISKVLTSVAIWQLIEEGKLKLTDKAALLVPDFLDDTDPNFHDKAAITIGELLSHQSRIPHYFDFEYDENAYRDEESDWNAAQSMNVFKRTPLFPNDTTVYSSFAYNLLGAVVEAKRGSYVRQADAIAKACGLNPFNIDSTYAGFGEICSDPTERETEDFRWVLPAGGWKSNISELTTFVQHLFWKKTLLKNPERMWDSIPDNGKYRYGIYKQYFNGTNNRDRAVIGHGGIHRNVRNYFGYIPYDDVAIVILTNTSYTNIERLFRRIGQAMDIPFFQSASPLALDCNSTEKSNDDCQDLNDAFLVSSKGSQHSSLIRRNYRYDAFYTEIKDLRKHGYQCLDMEVYVDTDGNTRWEGIFDKSKIETKVNRNLSDTKFKEKVDYWEKRGYYPSDIEVYQVKGKNKWAAIFVKGKASIVEKLPAGNVELINESMAKQGYQLMELEPYTEKNKVYYAAVWRKGKAESTVTTLPLNELEMEILRMRHRSQYLVDVETYRHKGKTYFTGIWRKGKSQAALILDVCELGEIFPKRGKKIVEYERFASNL
ncbi:MAG: serine hydrolase [Saprospiraceae bacterium]|nr:serine hydrolase [Saprospiraceae bacterium]